MRSKSRPPSPPTTATCWMKFANKSIVVAPTTGALTLKGGNLLSQQTLTAGAATLPALTNKLSPLLTTNNLWPVNWIELRQIERQKPNSSALLLLFAVINCSSSNNNNKSRKVYCCSQIHDQQLLTIVASPKLFWENSSQQFAPGEVAQLFRQLLSFPKISPNSPEPLPRFEQRFD